MKRWRLGIIGTGRHGSRYANHIVSDCREFAELSAICRRSAAKGREQAGQWQTAFHADWRQLIADPGVEAVIAATTPNLNPEIAEFALRHKKPLLIEKPLAIDAGAAQVMVDRFAEAGLPLTVGQTLRYNPIILGLRQALPRVGRPHSFCATHHLEPAPLPWLADPGLAGGGVIFHTAVHLFDALRFVTGQEVVRVRASSFRIHTPVLEDLFTAQIEMSSGLVGVVLADKVGRARAGRYEFTGEGGQIQGDQVHGTLELVAGAAVEVLPHGPQVPTIPPLLRDWIGSLSGERDNPIPGVEGLAAVQVCEACRQSARRGEWVAL